MSYYSFLYSFYQINQLSATAFLTELVPHPARFWSMTARIFVVRWRGKAAVMLGCLSRLYRAAWRQKDQQHTLGSNRMRYQAKRVNFQIAGKIAAKCAIFTKFYRMQCLWHLETVYYYHLRDANN
jgi:hypothetical protein